MRARQAVAGLATDRHDRFGSRVDVYHTMPMFGRAWWRKARAQSPARPFWRSQPDDSGAPTGLVNGSIAAGVPARIFLIASHDILGPRPRRPSHPRRRFQGDFRSRILISQSDHLLVDSAPADRIRLALRVQNRMALAAIVLSAALDGLDAASLR